MALSPHDRVVGRSITGAESTCDNSSTTVMAAHATIKEVIAMATAGCRCVRFLFLSLPPTYTHRVTLCCVWCVRKYNTNSYNSSSVGRGIYTEHSVWMQGRETGRQRHGDT